VAEQEKVNLTDDGEKALMTLSGGDMRKVNPVCIDVNTLKATFSFRDWQLIYQQIRG
jgi:DNA polymerase III delta prime subunit